MKWGISTSELNPQGVRNDSNSHDAGTLKECGLREEAPVKD